MKYNSAPHSSSPLSVWLSYLESLHDKTIDMGLTRVKQVAERLDVLKPAPFIFTVAGTNGKGSVCRTLELMLLAAGYRVGVYNSPHLVRYTERVRVQNTELPESAYTTSFAEIEAIRNSIPLTYFEYSTLSVLLLFKQLQLDIVILEVGLGGRLDATNIIDANIAVITNIALDHTDWLGSDRESIGREKAGIFRPGKLAVVGESDIPHTVVKAAREKGTYLFSYDDHWKYTTADYGWNFTDTLGTLNNLPFPQIPQSSAAIALAALRASRITISEQSIRNGIRNAILPGRFQIVSQFPRVILDVAHNPHAATYLSKRLASLPKSGRVLAVIGMMQDKDIKGVLKCMESEIDFWYFTSLKGPRGASALQLMKHLDHNISYSKVCFSVEDAWKAVIAEAKPEDTVLICGSFCIVACIMNLINICDINHQ